MDELSSPPLGSSSRSRNQSRNVSWSQRSSSLSLGNMMSKLSLMSNLSSPPLGSSSRSRNQSRNVSWSQRSCSLSLGNMMSKLSLMDELSSPPLGSSSRSRNQSRNVSRSQRSSSLSLPSLSYGHMMDITVGKVGTWESLGESSMVDITEGIVGTWQLSRCSYRSLGSTSRGQTLLVDLVVGGQQSVVTVGVGGAEGL